MRIDYFSGDIIMNTQTLESWGRYPKTTHKRIFHQLWKSDPLPFSNSEEPLLPYGLGRSYGDSCLNQDGNLIVTTAMNRLIHFDTETGLLTCESGTTLEDILNFSIPRGWFLPVTPGTKFVTVGGAIANDVHGKNHHRDGNFGNHILQFELARSDGSKHLCSPTQNTDFYQATIGGLGLTGLILSATIQLKKIPSPWIEMESIRYQNIHEFFELAQESDEGFLYTVAWIDGLAQGKSLGRGLFLRGNHAYTKDPLPTPKRKLTVPFNAPNFALNHYTIKLFNEVYYNKQKEDRVKKLVTPDSFFYPLDAIHHWNRIYGNRGFFQYQCVIPEKVARDGMHEVLEKISESGEGSFLAVLKKFGNVASPGMLSFPIQGATLALDFSNKGKKTLQLMEDLDTIVKKHGGRVYPAKDARMSASSFQTYFPQWKEFSKHIDPKFSSSFWRRVTVA